MSRTILIPAAIAGGLALLSTQAMAQYVDEVDRDVVVETRPMLQPYSGAPIVEERVYETRRVIERPPQVVERRIYRRAPSYETRPVEIAPVPPAPVLVRRAYGVRPATDAGYRDCRIIVRRQIDEFGDRVERRLRVCD